MSYNTRETTVSLSRSNSSLLVKVGSVFNKLDKALPRARAVRKRIVLRFPSRLNAMAIDPARIVPTATHIYTPGEVVFSIALFRTVRLRLRDDGELKITESSKRRPIIRHAYLLMKKALKFTNGFDIEVDNQNEMRHCGFGSSGSLIAAVAYAINEMYGNPIDDASLVRYLAQNHAEEIDGEENRLHHIQCIGGSATSGAFGGLLVLAGQSRLIARMEISSDFKVVIGLPGDFRAADSRTLMAAEMRNLNKFLRTGVRFGKTIAYNILHRMLPAMAEGDLATVGDVIYGYRFGMGSIQNCAFTYKSLPSLCGRLAYLKRRSIADVLSISSVGPAIFAITRHPDICAAAFKKEKLSVFQTVVNNKRYQIS